MSYCDSRDQDRGVCVCSVQLWIISTLFLLWPTCTERRIWEYAHMSARSFLLFYFHCEAARGASPYGKPYANFKLSVSAGDNLGHERHPRCTLPLNVRSIRSCTAESLPRCICRLLKVYKQFSPPSVFSSWRRFLWSPWKTPISTLLHSLWNQFSLFCSYSVWVAMDTAPKWFGLYMNLFMSVTWSGLECSFFAQPK